MIFIYNTRSVRAETLRRSDTVYPGIHSTSLPLQMSGMSLWEGGMCLSVITSERSRVPGPPRGWNLSPGRLVRMTASPGMASRLT